MLTPCPTPDGRPLAGSPRTRLRACVREGGRAGEAEQEASQPGPAANPGHVAASPWGAGSAAPGAASGRGARLCTRRAPARPLDLFDDHRLGRARIGELARASPRRRRPEARHRRRHHRLDAGLRLEQRRLGLLLPGRRLSRLPGHRLRFAVTRHRRSLRRPARRLRAREAL